MKKSMTRTKVNAAGMRRFAEQVSRLHFRRLKRAPEVPTGLTLTIWTVSGAGFIAIDKV